MTPEQIELARHALGLNREKVSYRNRFYAGDSHSDYWNWRLMVDNGDAIEHRGKLPDDDSCFCLTLAGAKKALKFREKLCPEDFPNA